MWNRTSRRSSGVHLSLAAVLIASLTACERQQEVDDELTQRLIQPVARVELKKEAKAQAAGTRSGVQVYQSVCSACHDTGATGAPKSGDTSAWAPRIEKGLDALTQNAIQGIGAMPPRGGAQDLSDEEVRRAVAYLANTAGGNFTVPEASAGEAPAAGAPADQAPAGQAPAGEGPAEGAPAGETPTDGAPASQ